MLQCLVFFSLNTSLKELYKQMLKHILYAAAHGYDNIKEAKRREIELEISHIQKELLAGAEKVKVPLSLDEYHLFNELIIYCFVVLIKNRYDH